MTLSELRAKVLNRDGQCILAQFDDTHECADTWGTNHSPYDLDRLTLEHVREHPGGRRRDELGWCVAMCHRANIEHMGSTTEVRRRLNDYLMGVRAQMSWEEGDHPYKANRTPMDSDKQRCIDCGLPPSSHA